MSRKILLLGFLLALLCTNQVFAATYYVSASSGSDTNDGSITRPWRTAAKACATLGPGDTACFAGVFQPESTYYMNWTGYITLFPQRSGKKDSVIVYRNWPDSARPVFVGKINPCSNSIDCYHTTILNYNKDYIIYDGLEQEYGYRGIWISSGHNVIVRNCVSHHSTGGDNNNTGNIYLGPGIPTDILIENNVCHDAMEASGSIPYTTGGYNTGGIFAEIEGWDEPGQYDPAKHAHRVIIQNNTIYSQGGVGIRPKRMIDSVIIRNNTIFGCRTEGIWLSGASGFCIYTYGNVIYDIGDNALVVQGRIDPKYVDQREIYAFNNTIYSASNSAIGVYPSTQWRSGHFFNNIFASTKHGVSNSMDASLFSPSDSFYFDYNCYYDADGWTWSGTTYSTETAWQQNQLPYIHGKDLNSTLSNPDFVDASGHDFSLSPNSALRSIFKDTTVSLWTGETVTFSQMGAYGAITNAPGAVFTCYGTRATDVTSTSATIRWSTGEPATSKIDYGLDENYGESTGENTSMVTEHIMILTGLTPGKMYFYQPSSRNAEGELCSSGSYTFQTLSPPDSYNVRATDIATDSAVIRWSTVDPATSSVTYGYDTDYGLATPVNTELVTEHVIILRDLDSSTVYHYQPLSVTADLIELGTEDYYFRTLDTIPPAWTTDLHPLSSSGALGGTGLVGQNEATTTRSPAVWEPRYEQKVNEQK